MLRPRSESVLAVALLLLAASAAPWCAASAAEVSSLAEAQAFSAERNAPVLIDFFAEW